MGSLICTVIAAVFFSLHTHTHTHAHTHAHYAHYAHAIYTVFSSLPHAHTHAHTHTTYTVFFSLYINIIERHHAHTLSPPIPPFPILSLQPLSHHHYWMVRGYGVSE